MREIIMESYFFFILKLDVLFITSTRLKTRDALGSDCLSWMTIHHCYYFKFQPEMQNKEQDAKIPSRSLHTHEQWSSLEAQRVDLDPIFI